MPCAVNIIVSPMNTATVVQSVAFLPGLFTGHGMSFRADDGRGIAVVPDIHSPPEWTSVDFSAGRSRP
jgi:hypothetical protein